jgi:3-hydroxyisobutyrate dehydrogenase-like beta-hydroxyacid dehydrogenase
MGVTLAEVFTMGIKAGVEPLDLWEAVRQGATGRQRTFDRLGRFLSGKYDPADFALRLLHKDVGLAIGLDAAAGSKETAHRAGLTIANVSSHYVLIVENLPRRHS